MVPGGIPIYVNVHDASSPEELMMNPRGLHPHGVDDGPTGACAELANVAPDLRATVSAHCPGCHGNGACVMQNALNALAEARPAGPRHADVSGCTASFVRN